MKYLMGIDFGTTTTAISCTRMGTTFEPELIEIDNQRTTESVLRLSKDKEIELVGLKAWEEIADAPERTFFEFKLQVGSGGKIPFFEGFLTAQEIGVLFLQNLRGKIERGLFGHLSLREIDEKDGMRTIIGHPSGWSEAQRKATIALAKEAGFPNVAGCEEPIGALYYHYHLGDLALEKEQKVLVYDFGGGTSDVAIIETRVYGEPRTIAISGTSDLGGRDFDRNIAFSWEQKLLVETGKNELSKRDSAWIRRHSRKIKENLSIAIEAEKNFTSETIPILQCKGGRDTFVLNTESFEKINKELMAKFPNPVWDALSSASLSPSDIDIVVMTGGSGRFYFVRKYLNEIFPQAMILRSVNPQETVSKGLALFSKALTSGRKSIRKNSGNDILRKEQFFLKTIPHHGGGMLQKKVVEFASRGSSLLLKVFPRDLRVSRKKMREILGVLLKKGEKFSEICFYGKARGFFQKIKQKKFVGDITKIFFQDIPQKMGRRCKDIYKLARRNRKNEFLSFGIVFFLLVGLFFSVSSGGDDAVISQGTTAGVPPVREKNINALAKIENFHERLVGAQTEKNVSLMLAMQSELDALNLSTCIPEVLATRAALSAWVEKTLDFERVYSVYPYDARILWRLPISKEKDALQNQGFLDERKSIEAFEVESEEYHYFFNLGKACVALGEKPRKYVAEYDIKLSGFKINENDLDKLTNYSDGIGYGTVATVTILTGGLAGLAAGGATAMMMEGDPDVCLIIAKKTQGMYVPIRIYPSSNRAYEDSLEKEIDDSFRWYLPKEDALYVFMFDIDAAEGELLDFEKIPFAGVNGWLTLGSGCRVALDVSVKIN